MVSFLIRLFRKQKKIQFDSKAPTIPQAFGMSEEAYNHLVNELVNFINPKDRLGSLDIYLNNKIFEKFNLNFQNPKDAAIFGYAFCAAIVLQHEVERQKIVNNVLQIFNPEINDVKKNYKTLPN